MAMKRDLRNAVSASLLLLAACVATIFVLNLSSEDAAITLEDVSQPDTAQPAQSHGRSQECWSIHEQLGKQHDLFWQEAKERIVDQFGEGVAQTIEKDFTEKIDEVENKMSLHGCVQGVATADDGPDCVMLRKMRSETANAVQDQVKELLAKDAKFAAASQNVDATAKDLEDRLVQLHCAKILATGTPPVAAVATTTPEESVPGAPEEPGVAPDIGNVNTEPPTMSKSERSSQNHLERVREQIGQHKQAVQQLKAEIEHMERAMARSLEAQKDALSRKKDEIAHHQAEIQRLNKQVKLVQWAQNQRDALDHGKPIPPPAAADYSKDTPSVLDQTIGNMFEQGFAHSQTRTGSTGTLLLQVGAGSPSADGKKSQLADFHDILHKVKPQESAVERSTTKVVKEMEEAHPKENAAVATASAIEAVNKEVRTAARTAALKAAREAQEKGLDAGTTKAYVKAAARVAAKQAARDAHTTFSNELEKQGTPQMEAKKRMEASTKELATKHLEQLKDAQERNEKDEASTKAVMEETRTSQDLVTAAKSAVEQASSQTGAQVKQEDVDSITTQLQDAEKQAVVAEAAAWRNDVGGTASSEDTLHEIEAYQKAHPELTLPQAAQKWEEGEVLTLKRRYARHFAKALTIDPSDNVGKLESLHEADRQKINVEKVVLKNAEMQAILAKRNAEKSEKSNVRLKEAAQRYQLAATDAIKEKVKQLSAATDDADGVKKKAIADILEKDATETLRAKTEANQAKAEAKHAEAAKKEALSALTVARKKLQDLSKAAAAGTAMLGVKLKEELKAQQEQVKQKVKEVKAATELAVQSKIKSEQEAKYQKMWQEKKANLEVEATKKSEMAQAHAAKVVEAAEEAAASAKKMAQKEAEVAEVSQAKSKEIADAAVTRAKAVKAAAAEQLAELAKQKKTAMQHFAEFSANLKELETEKSAKAEAKIEQKQNMADAATQEAARAARLAEQEMTEADLQRSQATIHQATAAEAQLQSAMDLVGTVDTRARGQAAIDEEKADLLEEKNTKMAKKAADAAKAKENKTKKALDAKEKSNKIAAAEKEDKAQIAAKKKKEEYDRIADEGYRRGVAHMKEVFAKKQLEPGNIAPSNPEAAQKAKAEAKAPQAAADAPSAAPHTVEQQAQKLVHEAVSKTSESGDATAAVAEASGSLQDFIDKHGTTTRVPELAHGGVAAEKGVKAAKLNVDAVAAHAGHATAVRAKAAVHEAAAVKSTPATGQPQSLTATDMTVHTSHADQVLEETLSDPAVEVQLVGRVGSTKSSQ